MKLYEEFTYSEDKKRTLIAEVESVEAAEDIIYSREKMPYLRMSGPFPAGDPLFEEGSFWFDFGSHSRFYVLLR